METEVLRAECVEPEGTVERIVREAPLTIERLRRMWENLSQFRVLFNEQIKDFDSFISTLIYQDAAGNIKPRGLFWEVDDVGLIYLTDIVPGFQADGHFTFWDRRLRGRDLLLLEMAKYLITEFELHRLVCRVPLYSQPTLRYVERVLKFTKEGRLREAIHFDGQWWDVATFSMLEGEIDGVLAAKRREQGSQVTSHPVGG